MAVTIGISAALRLWLVLHEDGIGSHSIALNGVLLVDVSQDTGGKHNDKTSILVWWGLHHYDSRQRNGYYDSSVTTDITPPLTLSSNTTSEHSSRKRGERSVLRRCDTYNTMRSQKLMPKRVAKRKSTGSLNCIESATTHSVICVHYRQLIKRLRPLEPQSWTAQYLDGRNSYEGYYAGTAPLGRGISSRYLIPRAGKGGQQNNRKNDHTQEIKRYIKRRRPLALPIFKSYPCSRVGL